MVIGNGMIAKKFAPYKDNDQFIIFASGVSNSKTLDPKEYNRETDLLHDTLRTNPGKTLVYFSSCSLYDPGEKNARYIQHKKEIETWIQEHIKHFIIFRVSHLVGNSSNPNTIFNYLRYHITQRINFDLWNEATRSLIDIDDMYTIVDHILQKGLFPNQVVNIANPKSYPVKDIVAAIETRQGRKATSNSIPKGNAFEIDITSILPIIQEKGIEFGEDYLNNLIRKYTV